jgi:biotin synthase
MGAHPLTIASTARNMRGAERDPPTPGLPMTACPPAVFGAIRHDWSRAEVEGLLALPLLDLLLQAQRVHREHHAANTVQMSTLLSIKTGACPEDCAYCPQSVRYETGLEREALMEVAAVRERAQRAKAAGATRFCMGAAYRSPKAKELQVIGAMVREVRALGMETCATLGMLTPEQALELKAAGLDYYNHNLDTSEQFYGEIITTRTYQDRLETLAAVRAADLKVCCGGILGMGESPADRAELLRTLANLPEHPESVPINQLVQVEGTPLAGSAPLDPFEFVRAIAVARLLMPRAHVRLSAGREAMSDEMQALCFMAGANSIFYGEKLLTTGNPDVERDRRLFERLGLKTEERPADTEAQMSPAAGEERPGAHARRHAETAP